MRKSALRSHGLGVLVVSGGAYAAAACFGSSSGGPGDGGSPETSPPADGGPGDGPATDGTVSDGAAAFEASADGGCVPGGGLQNGDFSGGLACWSTVVVSGSGSAAIGTSVFYAPTDANCDPLQTGHPFLSLNDYAADVYVSQTFTVPSAAQMLSWEEWNNLDPTTAKVSIVAGGTETVLDSSVPPSLQALSNPSDDYSVVCSGNMPTSMSKSIAQFAGQEVELRLRGTYVSGVNGLLTNYADVAVH
jgi:hypothetical protein